MTTTPCPPEFDAAFKKKFRELVAWRRDVRRFRVEPVDRALLTELIALATRAPSVGFSQPWRFVSVESPARRAAIAENFANSNRMALEGYSGDRRALYARLKLEGLTRSPVHLAVFADDCVTSGAGLGRQTMPETIRYSVVAAVHTFWLAARCEGLGVGWVSILDPIAATSTLDVPATWSLVAYLCVGWPEEEHDDPELERLAWQAREPGASALLMR
jgi:5,6-dimethylbenzimidazole synthase